MTEQTTALTVVERARKALVIKQTEDELKALAAKTADITTITNADGRQQVHAAYMVLKNERIDIQKRGKEARDDATKFSRAVIVEEDRIIALISHEEDRLQKLRDDWDEAIEAVKQAEIAAEQQRVADLQERVVYLRGNPTLTPLSGSALLSQHIADLEREPVDVSFEEFQQEAESTKAAGLARLRQLHEAAVAHEAEQERIKAEREELAKLRAEQAERDRLAAIERKALADKQAEELRLMRVAQQQAADAERKRIADEAAAAKAIRDAEAAKQAEELRLHREAQGKADAEAKAIRDAEAKKLADERAEFERQQAEARRNREEEERIEREQSNFESQSGGNPSEKSASGPADDRGIAAARSSDDGNDGKELPAVSIQSREPVDSNSVSDGAGEHGAIDTLDVLTPRHSVYAPITKPADYALLSVLASHYNVPTAKVIEWLLAVDFTTLENAA